MKKLKNARVIGIRANARAGKDELCARLMRMAHLDGKVYLRCAFADELKNEICDALGVTLEWIEQHKLELRPFLQFWGTELRRNMFGEDYWIKKLLPRLGAANSGSMGVIVVDVRFENEARFIQDLGGILVRIDSLRALQYGLESGASNHASENRINNLPYDFQIDNSKDLDHLQKETHRLYEYIQREAEWAGEIPLRKEAEKRLQRSNRVNHSGRPETQTDLFRWNQLHPHQKVIVDAIQQGADLRLL